MPLVILRELPASITLLTDGQLLRKLRAFNVDVGPILPTTREVYQRKLYALQTGQKVESYSDFPPADSDDQDEGDHEDEPILVLPQPRKSTPFRSPRQRSYVAERGTEQVERRREISKPSPRKPLHPGMGDYSRDRTPGNAKKTPAAAKCQSARPSSAAGPRLAVPLWVLVTVGIIIAIFVVLILKNMESEPDSIIPDEIEMNV